VPDVRLLRASDKGSLRAFLEAHGDTTMFLQGNSERAGLEYEGKPYQAHYVAAFLAERIVGVVAHWSSNRLALEAPVELVGELVRNTLRISQRQVIGMAGCCDQVERAREDLGWDLSPTLVASREILYRLELNLLRVPNALASGQQECRIPSGADLELLTTWRANYLVEALGRTMDQAKAIADGSKLADLAQESSLFVLNTEGECVAMTAFNTRTRNCVQVGGVWTPPKWRSQGFARSVVAGSLISARETGATRSILFTGEENYAAQACYSGLGYEVVGDYMLVDFLDPQG
jgi:RimJ/RimL family protein N-acetyltransferase